MITLFKKHFSEKENVVGACTRVFGLGRGLALQILDQLGIAQSLSLGDLSSSRLAKLEKRVETNYLIAMPLTVALRRSKARLASIDCYRASRHKKGLPARGQRTHGNAKTVRRLGRFILSHSRSGLKRYQSRS